MTTKDYYDSFVAPYLPQTLTYEQFCEFFSASTDSIPTWFCVQRGSVPVNVGKAGMAV